MMRTITNHDTDDSGDGNSMTAQMAATTMTMKIHMHTCISANDDNMAFVGRLGIANFAEDLIGHGS